MKFYAENPDKIRFTLTVTLPLEEWKKIKQAIGQLSEGGDIYSAIQDMIMKAENEFYPPLK